jgi:hypothetical protein
MKIHQNTQQRNMVAEKRYVQAIVVLSALFMKLVCCTHAFSTFHEASISDNKYFNSSKVN